MQQLIITLSFLLVLNSCTAQPAPPETPTPGAYQTSEYLYLLEGKNVGLVVNPTSEINGTHLVDTLLSLGINITKVFAPEHGFRGDKGAGVQVKDGVDTQTNLPIISLYGKNKKPNAAQFEGLDIIVFDIQDVGTRFYTYISTMHYVMETCAENNKPLLVLDRPNPNGMYVDGPVLDSAFQSFVGMHPIPVVHGLTVGELAQMINGEQWLNNKLKCELTVVPVAHYTHSAPYKLPVTPSPNLPNDLSIQLYPSLCLFEGTDISLGRGTTAPFQQIGHPSFSSMPHSFTPKSIDGMAKYPKHENVECFGIAFDEKNAITGFDLQYLISFYQKYEDKENFFIKFFDTLAGTDKLRLQIIDGLSEQEIKDSWQEELNHYKIMRKQYLLYPDFE